MNFKRRLETLEEQRRKAVEESHTLPPEVDLLLALHHQRSHARRDGKPVPLFSEAQVEEMHRQDLELTGPTMEEWRTTPGWTSEESQSLLDEWEEGALARLRDVDKGASKSEVYESVDEDETEDEDD
jgi:hypothetical protein